MDILHELESLASKRCAKLQSPNYINLTLSIVILLGILLSYLPQHYRIIARGTSEGISPFFILLGTTSGTSAFANILVLPASRADVACCKQISGFECAAGLLGIAQVGVQWFCFAIILLLFLIFFPRSPTLIRHVDQPEEKRYYTWKTAVTVAVICLLHGFVIIFVSGALLLAKPHFLGQWANALGIMATILAAIQYLPQIWMTWSLGHVGSLSIPMMCIQTPGSFVWSYSLYARLGVGGWSSWGVFLVTGLLQGCLLVMALVFEDRDRRARRASLVDSGDSDATCIVGCFSNRRPRDSEDEGGPTVEDEDETTPLMNGSQRSKKSKKSKKDARKSSGRSSRPQTSAR